MVCEQDVKGLLPGGAHEVPLQAGTQLLISRAGIAAVPQHLQLLHHRLQLAGQPCLHLLVALLVTHRPVSFLKKLLTSTISRFN